MEIGLPHVIAWIIVGILAGTVTGMIVKGDRRAFGVFRNLGLGMAGRSWAASCFASSGFFPTSTNFPCPCAI